ncbi:putative chorismate mutase [Nocardia nova SH22a]|uniref:chorismate mutase n=1 Tax=Nocardia nova SH22a TaxID=1415166 RepID=W5TCE9_9NOCA|nr:chorismate mutase [Nocardia nova]AHH14876.1 putative chorismate mutase [Nocardia nova SH22a]
MRSNSDSVVTENWIFGSGGVGPVGDRAVGGTVPAGTRAARRARPVLVAAAAALLLGLTGSVLPATAGHVLPAAAAAPVANDPESELSPLVDAVLRRLDTADAVAAAKWESSQVTGQPPVVDDPAREAQVYDAMAAAGARSGLPQDWVRQVFTGQIEANKTVQYGLLAGWRFDPAAVPATGPGLAAVRPIIDQVNGEILDQLAAQRAVLTGPDCAQRLASAVFPVLTSGRVDALHGAALVRATVTLCPTTFVK